MSRAQTWTIIFLLGVLTLALCWHFYRTEQYRQEQLSIERVRLGRALKEDWDKGALSGIHRAHRFIKSDRKLLAERNNPPPPPSAAEEKERVAQKAAEQKKAEQSLEEIRKLVEERRTEKEDGPE